MATLRLNLGCSKDVKPEWVNADIRPLEGVDVEMDMNERWPWEDDSFGYVLCMDVLEHGKDKVHLMRELWRVCAHGALVKIECPNIPTNPMGWADPTHRLVWHPENWDFCFPTHTFHDVMEPVMFVTLHHGHDQDRLRWRLACLKHRDVSLEGRHQGFPAWASSPESWWFRGRTRGAVT